MELTVSAFSAQIIAVAACPGIRLVSDAMFAFALHAGGVSRESRAASWMRVRRVRLAGQRDASQRMR